jgi:hypothetical protein
MQLFVSFGGMAGMVGLAWLLDQAGKVPVLFVDASETLAVGTNKPSAA